MNRKWSLLTGCFVVVLLAIQIAVAAGIADKLPAPATEAVKAAFPNAEIRGVTPMDDPDYGVRVFTVGLTYIVRKAGGEELKQYVMARVTEEGILILAMRQLPDAELPKAALEAMQKAAGEGVVKYPRRIEYFVDQKLVKFEKPRVQYEAMLVMKDNTRSNMRVAEDGGMIELTSQVAETDIPKPAMEAMVKAADGGKVVGPCRVETFVDEKMNRLKTPRVSYKAVLKKDKKFAKIEVSSDGTLIYQEPW